MAPRIFVSLLAALTLVPVAAQAASRPSFPRTVSGTISGSYVAKEGQTTYRASWSITGVRFKLVHIRSAEGSWTGFYNVAAGTVSYSESETGPCSYSVTDKFALKPAMPRPNPSAPLALTRSLLSRETYGGTIQPDKRWNVTETCAYPEQDPSTNEVKLEARNLFDTGGKNGKIGRAMKGRYVYKDDFAHSTKTFKWSLKPRR
jgi:hypothetical protein